MFTESFKWTRQDFGQKILNPVTACGQKISLVNTRLCKSLKSMDFQIQNKNSGKVLKRDVTETLNIKYHKFSLQKPIDLRQNARF